MPLKRADMNADFITKTGQVFRYGIPFFSGFVFVVISALSLPLPYISGIIPMTGLMAVYYWSIYRPELLRPFLVFLLGLLNDVLHMLPLGLSCFIFLCVYQVVFSQRRLFVNQVFYMVWFGFSVVALLASFVQWCVLSVASDQMLSIRPVFLQCLFSVVIFPFPIWILMKLQKICLSQE